MSEENNKVSVDGCGCGCGGCLMFIIFVFLFWAICFGLSINGKILNIDIFPPKIEYKEVEQPKADPIPTEKEVDITPKPKQKNDGFSSSDDGWSK